MATGMPIFKICPIIPACGLKYFFASPVFCLRIAANAIITLIVWDSVVPSAAPAAPSLNTPINR